MSNNKSKWQLAFLSFLIIGTVLILRKNSPFQTDQGLVFGTIYKITYQYEESLKSEIEKELKRVDLSLSPFNKESVITKINNNTDYRVDGMFADVFRLSKKISAETGNAFDITIAPLVNVWGFGFKNSVFPDEATVDSLLEFVGIDKVSMTNGRVIKDDKRTMLNCSAIAKGYGVDRVALLLESKGIKNYMVDIGGELRVKGENPKMSKWRIGINKPVEDSLSMNQELQTVLSISNIGLATSGNYRNFYYRDGKKYAHTVDPRTGYPVQHNILSATVIAPDCATADAYATAFMVMGLDSAKAICSRHPEIDAYFIITNESGKNDVYYTQGMNKYMN